MPRGTHRELIAIPRGCGTPIALPDYWGFGAEGLTALAAHAGFARVKIDATPTIDGHPRILATLEWPGG